MKRIDGHMHFWTLGFEPHYSWLTPKLTVLYRDYLPKDAKPLMQAAGVEGCVLVAAADSLKETGFLMGLAESTGLIRGVVAWVDLLAPETAKDLAYWARFRKFKGIRPYLQDIPQDDWILRPELDPALQAAIDLGLTFDILIYPKHLPVIVKFIERYPKLRVIIDHMAKPVIRNGELDAWRKDIEQFRHLKHVHCKISGILTEAGPGWAPERLKPYFDTVLDVFGPDRLVWGSDWPVVNLVADYPRWVKTVEGALGGLNAVDQQKVWADNAIRFYSL
jgi:L-fuconolactonase